MRVVSSSRAPLQLESLELRLVPAINFSPLATVPLSPLVVTSIPRESLHIHHYDLRTEGGTQALFAQTGLTPVAFNDTADSAEGTSVATDGSGNVYVAGDFTVNGVSSDYVAVFQNGVQSDFEVIDLMDGGGGNLTCKGIGIDPNGNIGLVGGAQTPDGNLSYYFELDNSFSTFQIDIAFGPGSSRSPQVLNAIQYDSNGIAYTAGVYSPNSTESSFEVAEVDTGGNPVVSGYAPASSLSQQFLFTVRGSAGLGAASDVFGNTWAIGGYAVPAAHPNQAVVMFGDVLPIGTNPLLEVYRSDPNDTFGQDIITSCAIGPDGKQYFAGQIHENTGVGEAAVFKTTANLRTVIYQHFQTDQPGSIAYGITITSNNQAVVTGSVPSDPTQYTGTQGLLLLVGDGGTTGTTLDEYLYGDPNQNTVGTGIVLTSDGSIWVSGNTDDPNVGQNYLGQFSF
jgi:hypothetical protein